MPAKTKKPKYPVTGYADPVGIPEIAERLGVSRRTVETWGHRGLLPDHEPTPSKAVTD